MVCDRIQIIELIANDVASFNEKLLLHNGLAISPMKDSDGEQSGRSLQAVVAAIDNDRDMNYYIASYASKVPPKPAEIKYERHSVLNPVVQPQPPPQTQRQSEPMPNQSFNSRQGPPGPQSGAGQSPIVQSPQGANSMAHHPAAQSPISQGPISAAQRSTDNRGYSQGSTPGMPPHDRSFSMGQPQSQHQSSYNTGSMSAMSRNGPPQQYNTGSIGSNGPPQLSSLPFQTQQSSGHQGVAPVKQNAGGLAPVKPVFGLTLEQLFDRDGSAVPMVVYQCIQAVDLFGLEVEGIYRLSGTSSHIHKIKAIFDSGKSRSSVVHVTFALTISRCVISRFQKSRKLLSRRQ